MIRFRMAAFSVLLLLAVVLTGCGQKMTPARFRELVATPGDRVPLAPLIANGSPHWAKSVASLDIHYASGQVYREDLPITSKTIRGQYIVFTAHSGLYRQDFHSILACDEKAGTLKVYSLYGNELVSADIVYNPKAKTYKETSAYGDGFTEKTTGWYSDQQDCARTQVYQKGVWFATRNATNRPAAVSR